MTLSQDDIDAVLNNVEAAVAEISAQTASFPAPTPPPPQSHNSTSSKPSSDRARRVLSLEVPVIVRLAQRSMRVGDILQWGRGTIVEFNRSVDSRLDLMINNCVIGSGEAVKVGENFGMRVVHVGDAAARSQWMRGKQ